MRLIKEKKRLSLFFKRCKLYNTMNDNKPSPSLDDFRKQVEEMLRNSRFAPATVLT